jgi:hypothetical protein
MWVKDAYNPLDRTNIPGSPHEFSRDFKEWLPIFSRDDLLTTEDHLYSFLRALKPYDQHEDAQMRLLSYTLYRRDTQLYVNILPRTITNWDLFQERFVKRFEKKQILSVPL